MPVPEGSDWTGSELADVRVQLLEQRDQMQAEYDEALQELDELTRAGADHAGDDQADAGSKTFEREQELSITDSRRDRIEQINHAIERIDTGRYGYCENCGRPIPKARLKAFPMATLDIECKQRQERR